MKSENRSRILNFICIMNVMATAVFVRLPSAYLHSTSPENREAWCREDGIPYLAEPDSYYHVRITENYLKTGHIEDAVTEDGNAWDTQSFYPEGRTADYPPGIVVLTAAVYRILHPLCGADLYRIEFCLAACMSAVTAAAAFAAAGRFSGKAGGFVAGIAVSCASGFAARTSFGRFDTDMFVVLMDVLLILFMAEALREREFIKQLVYSACYGFSALLYTVCWTPRYAMLYVCLVLAGGAVFTASLLFAGGTQRRLTQRILRVIKGTELRGIVLSAVISAVLILWRFGTGFIGSIIYAARYTTFVTAQGELPNVLVSVSELEVPSPVPEKLIQWFSGYVPGQKLSMINGVGGVAVFVLAAAALIMLAYGFIRKPAEGMSVYLDRRSCSLYFCILFLLFAGSVYACGRGMRFIEHLSVPVGLLAGALIGWFCAGIIKEGTGSAVGRAVPVVILCIAAGIPVITGSRACSADVRPCVSDAYAMAMQWIRENADDPESVIASWWDQGYFFESESGHPCFWDGGTTESIRAILIAKALTADSRELSERILHMLSAYGNRPVELLREYTDTRTAFDAIWETLLMDRQGAEDYLIKNCAMPADKACEAACMLHPEAQTESWLVVTERMMQLIGWIEYFSDWDFTGNMPRPAATVYKYTPDGKSVYDTEEGREYLEKRNKETLWKLFFDKDGGSSFRLVFEKEDGIDHVMVWRVGEGD